MLGTFYVPRCSSLLSVQGLSGRLSTVVPHTVGSSSRRVHLLCTLDHTGCLVPWCQPLISGRGHATFCKCQNAEAQDVHRFVSIPRLYATAKARFRKGLLCRQ